MVAQLGAVLQEPFHPARELRQALQDVRLERLDREERDQSHHGPHLERRRVAVRQVQHVVEEAVLLVPQLDAFAGDVVHRARDVDEVLEELRGDVLVGRILARQLERDGQHVEAVHRHPRGAVGLLDRSARRQRRAAIEHADVVEAEEAALEDVLALGVLAVDPPGEVQQELVEGALEEIAVGLARDALVDLVHAPRGPGMHRRIDVAERPLVGRDLPVRVHVPLAEEQRELLLRELRIDE